jgi:hypothetical protein
MRTNKRKKSKKEKKYSKNSFEENVLIKMQKRLKQFQWLESLFTDSAKIYLEPTYTKNKEECEYIARIKCEPEKTTESKMIPIINEINTTGNGSFATLIFNPGENANYLIEKLKVLNKSIENEFDGLRVLSLIYLVNSININELKEFIYSSACFDLTRDLCNQFLKKRINPINLLIRSVKVQTKFSPSKLHEFLDLLKSESDDIDIVIKS